MKYIFKLAIAYLNILLSYHMSDSVISKYSGKEIRAFHVGHLRKVDNVMLLGIFSQVYEVLQEILVWSILREEVAFVGNVR